jgi:hypothetical protein
MEEVPSITATTSLANRPDRSHGRLRAELVRDYETAYGRPVRNYLQADLLERAANWLLRAQQYESPEIRRSWPQIARGCGYPPLTTVRETKSRQCRSLLNVFGYLQAMGWVEGWESVIEANGSCTGITLRVGPRALSRRPEPVSSPGPRGYSSVGRATARRAENASHSPPGRPPGEGREPAEEPAFSGGVLSTPLRGDEGCCSSVEAVAPWTAGVGARVPSKGELERRERAQQASRARGAALSALRQATKEVGVQALWSAVEAGGDPLTVAVIAWECSGVNRQAHPALTARRREHLERYCAIADRLLGPGAGLRYLLDVILGHRTARAGEQVCSLDHFVCALRRWVRATRRAQRGRPPIPHERAGWFLEREERREYLAALEKLSRRRRGRTPRARRR